MFGGLFFQSDAGCLCALHTFETKAFNT